MENKKIEINIVYSPQTEPPAIVYENDLGIIWNSPGKNTNMHNIGMGWYSIRDPEPNDSILVMEPFCVLERDYDLEFVKKFKHIFTWAIKAFEDESVVSKVVEINHPSCHDLPSKALVGQDWPGWDKRNNEIVFIANNKYSLHNSELYSFRLQLADMLHKHSKYSVSWYGEIPINKPYYRGKAFNKLEILKKAKFSVCTENSIDPIYTHNYFTEKMPEVWLAGAMPIYMGCYNIDSFGFADHSYIDLRIYCQKQENTFKIDNASLISRIEAFDAARYEGLKADIVYNVNKQDGLYHIISFKRVYEKIIQTYTTSH